MKKYLQVFSGGFSNLEVDIEKLKEVLDDEVAALMLTNPSTLGLFEKNIKNPLVPYIILYYRLE